MFSLDSFFSVLGKLFYLSSVCEPNCRVLNDLSSEEQSLVSVIIPTHKRPQMLVRAVESVLAQTYSNLEIIIVDDNSGAETERIANQLTLHPQVKYFKSPRRGACAARNFGIRQALGFFITGLDDDDLFTPRRIEKLVNAYDSDYAFVAARSAIFETEIMPQVDEEKGRTRIFSLSKLLDNNRVGNQALVERNRILSVGGFDEKLRARQDYDLWVRLVEKFGAAKVITNKLYLRNESFSHGRISKSRSRKRGVLQFYKKHYKKMNYIQRYRYFSLMRKSGINNLRCL